MVISAAIRVATIAKRFAGYAKPIATGDSFVSRFPPNYRGSVRTIMKGSEIAFTGGLVADFINQLTGTGTTGENGKIQPIYKQKTDKFSQKYSRRSVPRSRSGSNYKRYNNQHSKQLGWCCCNCTHRK